MYKEQSITVIIPCLNEEQGIEKVLRAMPDDLPLSLEIPYAKPMAPLERARRAYQSTVRVLEQL